MPGPNPPSVHVTFEETLGSKNRAAIYVGLALKDTGDTSTLGCDASLDGGIYLFDQKRQLVKVGASGRVVNSQLSGSLDLYLAGKAVDGYPKKGSATATYAKAIQSPSAGYTYGWGPLSISITGAIGAQPADAKKTTPIVSDWSLYQARQGMALIEGRAGLIQVEPGDMLPGLGRVDAIRKQDGRWVVVTSRGLIVER